MNPQVHFILGIPFIAILYFFFSPVISVFGLTIIFLSSVLIDADHYIYYIFKKKNFNPFKSYEWYKKNTCTFCSLPKEKQKEFYLGFYFLHGIETLILLFFLGVYLSPVFILILIGFLFHLFVDFSTEVIYEQRFSKLSVIYNLFSFRKLTNFEAV